MALAGTEPIVWVGGNQLGLVRAHAQRCARQHKTRASFCSRGPGLAGAGWGAARELGHSTDDEFNGAA